jgi:beta-barrel assembly-enhancing protease
VVVALPIQNLTTFASFDTDNGANPYYAPVVQGTNGHLYETTFCDGRSFHYQWRWPNLPHQWDVAAQRHASQSAGVWLFALFLLFSLWLGRASAQDTSLPESKASHNDSTEVISKTSEKKKVPSKYDINHIGDRGVGNGANKYSLERERKLGHALAQDVELNTRLVTDPVITEYVNRLGQRIVGNSDARVPVTIKVIESDDINAFTLPGGYLYVHTGLILAADNEAELAGVMAHEVAHVAARHATRAATRMDIWRYASIPLLFGGLAGVVTPMLFMKFGRDAEREADLLGLEYEFAAGYDPQAFIQFFEKLHAQEKQRQNLVARAFATHPVTEDRIRRAQREISSLLPDKDEYVVDTSEFQEVKARVARLVHERPVLHRRSPEEHTSTGGPTLRPTNN